MAAPGALTNIVSGSSAASSNTSASVTLNSGTVDKIAILALVGDHTADSLTVDTSGWTALTPIYQSGGAGQTVMLAYKANTSDTSVAFSWGTGSSYAIAGAHSPDTDFSSDVPVQTTGGGTGDPLTAPNAVWTPTDRDIRSLAVTSSGDGRRTIVTYPDADNNTTVDAGGLSDAILAFCTAGVTASSPYSPGDWDWSGNQNAVMITVALLDPSAGSTTLTGSLYTPTPVFGTGTVTPGSVSVSGSVYAPSPVFNTGTITAGLTLVGSAAYTPTLVFGTGAVSVGSVTLTGSLHAPTLVFGTGSVYEPSSTVYPGGLVAADFAALYDGRNLTSGDISSWTDESGNGRHLTTISGVTNPSVTTSYFGGRKAALFDVSSQEALEYDEGSEFYTGDIGFITVFQFVSLSTTDDRVLFSAATGGSGTTWKHIGAHTYAPPGPAHQYVLMSGDGSPGAHILFGTPDTASTHIMTQYIRNSGDDDAWIDKTQELDATNSGGNNLRGWRLGAREDSSRWLDGVIAYHCIIEMDGLTEADLLAARDDVGQWFGIDGFGDGGLLSLFGSMIG